MPIVRFTQTRPSPDIEFYIYDWAYLVKLRGRHKYETYITSTQDGLTRTVEMTFATQKDLDAWQNDPERAAVNELVHNYNVDNGITVVREILS